MYLPTISLTNLSFTELRLYDIRAVDAIIFHINPRANNFRRCFLNAITETLPRAAEHS